MRHSPLEPQQCTDVCLVVQKTHWILDHKPLLHILNERDINSTTYPRLQSLKEKNSSVPILSPVLSRKVAAWY